MWGMLRCRREQAWQTNTPRVSEAQSGSAGCGERRGEPGGEWDKRDDLRRAREREERRKTEEMKLGEEAREDDKENGGGCWREMKEEAGRKPGQKNKNSSGYK